MPKPADNYPKNPPERDSGRKPADKTAKCPLKYPWMPKPADNYPKNPPERDSGRKPADKSAKIPLKRDIRSKMTNPVLAEVVDKAVWTVVMLVMLAQKKEADLSISLLEIVGVQ